MLWSGPLIVAVVFAWAIYQSATASGAQADAQTGLGRLVGLGVGTFVFTLLLGPVLLRIVKLVTEVRSDGLYVRFYPVHLSFKPIALDRVVKLAAVRYRPIRQYGGWGIRRARGGKAYNVKGDKGVRLDFDNGRHLLIGSQQPDELEAAIRSIIPAGHVQTDS